jgi:prolyl-tRNA editing enzyme YbaK/EbsC (Cys-tRNA(Pro) deacylase)
MDSAEAAVRDHLETLGVEHEILPCDPERADTVAFCSAYGYELADSANTILVAGKRGAAPPSYVACVVLATTRLDVNGAVRRRLGAKKASFASAEETAALTGMLIGGVTAFGLPADLPIWVDARVMSRSRIILGAGSRSAKVATAPASLLAVPGVEIVDDLASAAPE